MSRRALISTSDKSGLEELARALIRHGIEIVSTGSTAATIRGFGVAVTSVGSVTGYEEILDGRVKTLHPAIFGGILADRRKQHHVDQIAESGIEAFDFVIVNLYPFAETVRTGAAIEECIEQIDIGGPALIRAAAKNYSSVTVVVSPSQYPTVIRSLDFGKLTDELRAKFAAEAFAYVTSYDINIAMWMQQNLAPSEDLPTWVANSYRQQKMLRYGENPHQQGAVYETESLGGALAGAELLHGKEMSYNNYLDANFALRAVYDFSEPCVAIIKHNNPCGIAVATSIDQAHLLAHECDPVSAFGGVVAANRFVNLKMAEQLVDVFTEVVIAPGFDPEALQLFEQKPSMRVLVVVGIGDQEFEVRTIDGGLLLQTKDLVDNDGDRPENWTLVSGQPADQQSLRDLEFAWRSVRSVKSNAIVIASQQATVGIGMGQVNRVDAARLAVARAGERATRAVAASDAFFPFPDALEVLIAAGINAVVQPGGSVRDDEVITAAKSAGITMYVTGVRHFTH